MSVIPVLCPDLPSTLQLSLRPSTDPIEENLCPSDLVPLRRACASCCCHMDWCKGEPTKELRQITDKLGEWKHYRPFILMWWWPHEQLHSEQTTPLVAKQSVFNSVALCPVLTDQFQWRVLLSLSNSENQSLGIYPICSQSKQSVLILLSNWNQKLIIQSLRLYHGDVGSLAMNSNSATF